MTAIYFLLSFSTFLSFAEKCSVMCLLPAVPWCFSYTLLCPLWRLASTTDSFYQSLLALSWRTSCKNSLTNIKVMAPARIFYDTQLFKFNNLPLTLYFFKKVTRCRSSEEDPTLKGMKENGKDVEM